MVGLLSSVLLTLSCEPDGVTDLSCKFDGLSRGRDGVTNLSCESDNAVTEVL